MMTDAEQTIPCVLACDIGNTSVQIACVEGQKSSSLMSFPNDDLSGLADGLATAWSDMGSAGKIAACSVNPATLAALEAAATETIGQDVLVIGRDLPLPIETNLPHPAGIGTDRLCAAAAAYDQLGVACVVADFGSAITIDCVNEDGLFQGGAILPGLQMSARALASQTAQLPEVKIVEPDWVYGQDTNQAIIGGLIHGARGALRELVETYATEMGAWPLVILTGGDARVICKDVNESEIAQAVVDDLVLRGVAIAYYKFMLQK
ncbi:MAG: type III pantothenate kinase [Phycisphaerae bacterium]|jgi:type III pantothenate kinase|nr:type III pantothenate kinase [Phycisphaerae bacterium]MDP7289320.1 type III pantothenate kinase [Phycisphaerae bacterium]